MSPGSTPLRIAAVSTIVLKAEPGWRWPWAARLKRRSPYVPLDAIARIFPLFGSIATIAEAGPAGSAQ